MAVEYNFTLDMDRSKRDNNIAYARTGDIDSIVINADLVFNGASYTPTGTNAFFECITPNGHSIRAAAQKSGSTVSVEVPSAAFQAAGVINVAYFRFESGDTASPTYVESTEPFAIVVREGIGDNIDAGDYIEGWRLLADQIEALKDEVEQKAQQAEAAISEQKEEVDALKAQAQTEIAGDVTAIESAKTQAISDINGYKADVADAAEGITAAGEQAISQFNTNSQQAINSFNSDGASAISQFNTDADSKLDEVDGMITGAQGDVNAAITQLETATSQAVDAMEDALEGTTAGSLQNAINRTLKLDVADMTNIPDNASLSSFTNVGSYCCKSAATAATVNDCPVDDSPFNMYVFSSATSGQVMQLVVPIDLNGKPTAEWHVRFGTSSAMDTWSVIGGGADIAAGLGIDVTGDAQKTVALDTSAFYEHVGPSYIVSGSTEVTGGGRFKEVRIKGKTLVNRWPVIEATLNGITVSTDETGLVTITGTATAATYIGQNITSIAKNANVTIVRSTATTGININVEEYNDSGFVASVVSLQGSSSTNQKTGNTGSGDFTRIYCNFNVASGTTVNASFRVMLVDGTEAPDCFTPPASIASVEVGGLVTAGKNLLPKLHLGKSESVGVTATLNDDKSITLNGTTTSRATFMLLGAAPYTDVLGEFVPGTYTLSVGSEVAGIVFEILDWREQKAVFAVDTSFSPSMTKTLSNITEYTYIRIQIKEDVTLNNVTIYPKLELGSTPTAYEPPTVTKTTLPEVELRGLPNGTCDELVIRADGTCEVERRIASVTVSQESDVVQFLGSGSVKVAKGTAKPDQYDGVPICDKIPSGYNRVSADNVGDVFIFNGWTSAEEAKVGMEELYPLTVCYVAKDETTEPQSPVTLPALPAPTFNAYASSNVPAEIEAEVVKVDYLPAPDVYTREEVDQKIEDAGGMPDIVPVSQGGTGVTTAAAERNRLGLGNTTGALPVANGGTGATTAKAAQNSLLNDMNVSSDTLADNSMLVGYNASPSASNGAVHRRSMSTVWNYIVSKIRSVFGFNSSNVLDVEHGGTGFNDFPAMLVNLESASTASLYQIAPRPGVTGTLPVSHGGTGGTSASSARTNLDVYSKSEVDGKIPKVVIGSGNIPSDAEAGTIYINYQ